MKNLVQSHHPLVRWTGVFLSAAALAASLGFAPMGAQAQARELPDFTELVERTGPAVVNIRTAERMRAQQGMPEMDEQMQEFLRRFGVPIPNQRRGAPRDDDAPQRRGVGSGFIISGDGYVMTNAHVVDGADEVLVTLTDKREFKAKLVGTDARTDVAVLKIEASGLPAVKIGDVGRLKVGEWVLAIGSPFGFDNTVTAGIVSAKARDTGELLPFIQTDVAINPGNSGGPLLNMRGEVVGINSQIYSRSGGFMGISFAIPIDEAMRVSEQLRGGGRVIRGRIGVLPDDVSKEVAEAIGLGRPVGAVVRNVVEGSPAEKAGIEAGDVITRFDGKSVDKANDLRRLVAATKPGTKVSVQVFRRGASKELSVTVAELTDERPRAAAESNGPAAPIQAGALGLTVADLSDGQKRELKLRQGVRVTAAEGAAARSGVREGDVILSVNNQEVVNVKQFQTLLAAVDKSKVVTLLVRRDNSVSFVLVKPSR
ncbi:DegQ family serine endoprotease [Roseateles sp.]|jgi:serine protease Do|uniref:DegQ family serine endoprotease n=1 Tax=Roseateles sp. TaxID=1971397 RepID=UPI0037CC788E